MGFQTPCHVWRNDPNVYPSVRVRRGVGVAHTELAHRRVWEEANGPLDGRRLRRLCGVKGCVRLDHMTVDASLADASHSLHGDPWFTGFTDGEGCFFIARNLRGGFRYFRPSFCLTLRDDDGEIIRDLCRAFGGAVRHTTRGPNTAPTERLKFAWSLSRKEDLCGLVAYFDRFPPRGKKRHEYPIWREAVNLYVTGSGKSPGLPDCHAALLAARAYEGAR